MSGHTAKDFSIVVGIGGALLFSGVVVAQVVYGLTADLWMSAPAAVLSALLAIRAWHQKKGQQ